MEWLRILWRLFQLSRKAGRLWWAARQAVEAVAKHRELQSAAELEPAVSYCPRCGQRPDGDRRFEEAREIALVILSQPPPMVPKRRDLDFALAFHYWRSRL